MQIIWKIRIIVVSLHCQNKKQYETKNIQNRSFRKRVRTARSHSQLQQEFPRWLSTTTLVRTRTLRPNAKATQLTQRAPSQAGGALYTIPNTTHNTIHHGQHPTHHQYEGASARHTTLHIMARSSQPILSQVIIMALPQAQRHRRQRRHRRLHPCRTGATSSKPARPRAAHQPLRRQHITLQPCSPPQNGSPQ